MPITHQRILIAEDEENVRMYFMNALKKKGYFVDGAINGKEALEKIKKVKPDLLITDGVMPEMTGFELCRLLHTDDKTKDIPILLCTASSAEDLKEKGVKADAYLRKPIEIEELYAAVDKLLAP